jgi:U11/U12 small nuclear ribonucleoprotein SNRNP65
MLVYTLFCTHEAGDIFQFNMFSRFDIRLMQSGRMKGQAFISLPEESMAVRALEETNGYLLHGKPMVVVSS